MNVLDQSLIDSLSGKPEFLRSNDLIDLGLYQSFADVCWAKKRGLTPPSIHLSERKIVYPKRLLLDWLYSKTLNQQEASISKIEKEAVND